MIAKIAKIAKPLGTGWAANQFERVTDASRQSTNVGAAQKVQMIKDYLQTCFNMHLGLIDTKSLRSKSIYWAHRLLQEADATSPFELAKFFKEDMRLGTDRVLLAGARTQAGKTLADGGYAQVSFSVCSFTWQQVRW